MHKVYIHIKRWSLYIQRTKEKIKYSQVVQTRYKIKQNKSEIIIIMNSKWTKITYSRLPLKDGLYIQRKMKRAKIKFKTFFFFFLLPVLL